MLIKVFCVLSMLSKLPPAEGGGGGGGGGGNRLPKEGGVTGFLWNFHRYRLVIYQYETYPIILRNLLSGLSIIRRKEKHKKYYCFPVTTCALIISILPIHFKPARSITRTFSLSPNCSRLEKFYCECTDNQFDI